MIDDYIIQSEKISFFLKRFAVISERRILLDEMLGYLEPIKQRIIKNHGDGAVGAIYGITDYIREQCDKVE
jgi:hypothetical protein